MLCLEHRVDPRCIIVRGAMIKLCKICDGNQTPEELYEWEIVIQQGTMNIKYLFKICHKSSDFLLDTTVLDKGLRVYFV